MCSARSYAVLCGVRKSDSSRVCGARKIDSADVEVHFPQCPGMNVWCWFDGFPDVLDVARLHSASLRVCACRPAFSDTSAACGGRQASFPVLHADWLDSSYLALIGQRYVLSQSVLPTEKICTRPTYGTVRVLCKQTHILNTKTDEIRLMERNAKGLQM